MRDVEAFNDALVAKIVWRIISKPESLVTRVLCGRYCPNTSFLKTTPSNAASHGWKSILRGRDLLIPHISKAIGNGESTIVWDEPWISTECPLKPMGPPNRNDQQLRVSDLLCDHTKEWNIDLVNRLLPQYANDIFCLKPSKGLSTDKYIWSMCTNGEYPTKTGYHSASPSLIAEDAITPPNRDRFNWNKEVWKASCSPKIQLFLWKVVQGALPLGENLKKRGLRENTRCCLCGENETAIHLFVQCPFAANIWGLAPLLNNPNFGAFTGFANCLQTSKRFTCLPPTGLSSANIFPWLCWAIWTARNKIIFENRTTSVEDVISKAVSEAAKWQRAQLIEIDIHAIVVPSVTSCLNTTRNLTNHTKVCTDVAWSESRQTAGLG